MVNKLFVFLLCLLSFSSFALEVTYKLATKNKLGHTRNFLIHLSKEGVFINKKKYPNAILYSNNKLFQELKELESFPPVTPKECIKGEFILAYAKPDKPTKIQGCLEDEKILSVINRLELVLSL